MQIPAFRQAGLAAIGKERRFREEDVKVPPKPQSKRRRLQPKAGIATKKGRTGELLPFRFSKYIRRARTRSAAWWLRASWLSSAVSLPCSYFLRFGLPDCLATQNTMQLACQVGQGIENLASPCRTCRCADAPRRIRQKNGRLGVDLINRPDEIFNRYCSEHFPGLFPEARLLVSLGSALDLASSTSRQLGSPVMDLGGRLFSGCTCGHEGLIAEACQAPFPISGSR